MLKQSLLALLAVAGGAASFSAVAASDNARCSPPAIKASPAKNSSQFHVNCETGSFMSVKPTVTFTGTVGAPSNYAAEDGVDVIAGKSNYNVMAKYIIDVRDDHSRKLGTQPRADQELSGHLKATTQSLAGLGGQFSLQTVWDDAGVLSVEERDGKWRVYSLQGSEVTDRVSASAKLVEVGIMDAGVADTAFTGGRATLNVDLGDKVSRFAAKEVEDKPTVTVALGLVEGKLAALEGATVVANHEEVQNALLRLDRGPKDMSRAWGLAARAQMLGLGDEVAYAEKKVAAHNPQLLEEFQKDVRRILPFKGPRAK